MRKVTLRSGATSGDFRVSLGVGCRRGGWAPARGVVAEDRASRATAAPSRNVRDASMGGISSATQVLESDVLERHLHALEAGVQLPGDDPLVRQLREVGVDGGRAVELDRHVLADAADGEVV